MHKIFWEDNQFKSTDVEMFGHSCGISQFPQTYDRNNKKYKVLSIPYVGSYEGEKGSLFLK